MILLLLASVVATLLLGVFIVTRPTVLATIVQWRMGVVLGGSVTIGEARWLGGGSIRLDDVTVRVPDWPGESGELLRAARIEATVSRSRLLAGSVLLKALGADDVRLRFAERENEPGRLNFMDLRTPTTGTGDGRIRMPRLSLPELTVEMGHLDAAGEWTLGGRIDLAGDMRGDPDDAEWIRVRLEERNPSVADSPLRVSGRFHPRTLDQELEVDAFRLDQSRRGLLPLQARAWWDRLDITGEIAGASLRITEGRPYWAEVKLLESRMTMPVETAGQWSRLRGGLPEATDSRPRLQVDSGLLRLDGLRLSMERVTGSLIGTDPDLDLANVPFRIDFSLPELPPLRWEYRDTWLDDVLDATAFKLVLDLPEFSVIADADGLVPSVELPTVVAEALAIFRLTEWHLSTEVTVSRAAPILVPGEHDDDPGHLVAAPTLVEGQAYVRNARGSYRRFDYPMHDVAAHLSFDQDRVTVNYLTGRTASGSSISAQGSVAPPGPGAGVDLRIIANRVPVDGLLREALPEGVRRAIDSMMHEPSANGLRAAGLIPDPAAIDAARKRRQTIRTQALDPTRGEATGAHERELAELERVIEGGPFELGGVIDIIATISRREGENMPTEVGGEVTLDGLGVVLDRFPYPLRIVSGTLRLLPDAVNLGDEGLLFETAGGGVGRLAGTIEMPRIDGRRRLRPKLRATLADDRVTPVLIAAVPPTDGERAGSALDEWPGALLSRGGRLIDAFGLEAGLAAIVTIDNDEHERLRWEAIIDLDDGIARPDTSDGSAIETIGVRLPHGTTLRALDGTIGLSAERIVFDSVTGTIDDATLSIHGEVGLRDSSASDLAVGIGDLVIDREQLVALPRDSRAMAEAIWDEHQPSGIVDLRVLHERRANTPASTTAVITPRTISLLADDERIIFSEISGRVHASGTAISFDELQVAVEQRDRSHGRVNLDGRLRYDGTERVLRGLWSDGAFESALVRETLRRLGLTSELETWRRLDASGRFDAEFDVAIDESSRRHDLRLIPHHATLTSNDHRVAIRFDDGGSARVMPGRIVLDQVRGRIDDATASVDGVIRLRSAETPRAMVDLTWSLDAPRLGDGIDALLPSAVRRVLNATEFEVDGAISTDDAHLTMRREDAGWRSRVRADLLLRGASFRAGIGFGSFDGVVALDAAGGAARPASLHADATFDRLRAVGRLVTDGSGTLRLDDTGRTLLVENLHGTTYRGRVEASGSVETIPGGAYEASVSVAGAALAGVSRGSSDGEASFDGGSGGLLTARVDLAGSLGDPASRRGRGGIQVREARMAEAPLTLRLLQVFQLMLPLSGSLESADISFFIDGGRLTFERLELQSDTLRLVGSGGMDIDGLILDTRFSSRGTLALFSDLMGGLTDQLIAIEVTGPLDSPKTRVLPLPGLGSASPTSAPAIAPIPAAMPASPTPSSTEETIASMADESGSNVASPFSIHP